MTSTNRRRELENQDASPVVAWLHRFSAFALIFLSASFTIWFRLDDQFMSKARNIVSDVFRPVAIAIYVPVVGVSRGLESIGDHFDTVTQLDALRDENAQIPGLKEEINRLQARVKVAEELARIPVQDSLPFLSPRVINANSEAVADDLPDVVAISNLADRRLIKINAGQLSGVQEDFPVINEIGLVGRVIWAGQRTATVMLVFDTASSVPALIEPLNARVTIKGTGRRNSLEVKLAPSQALSEVKIGDRIVTSGQGELFPPGVLIGTVSGLDRGVDVTPAVDWDRLVNVRVLPRSGARR